MKYIIISVALVALLFFVRFVAVLVKVRSLFPTL